MVKCQHTGKFIFLEIFFQILAKFGVCKCKCAHDVGMCECMYVMERSFLMRMVLFIVYPFYSLLPTHPHEKKLKVWVFFIPI